MRRAAVSAWLAGAVLAAWPAAAGAASAGPTAEGKGSAAAATPRLSTKLDIRVEKGDWGGASQADIRKVLLSAAGELWVHFPGRRLAPIIVRRRRSGPIVLYDRAPGGEYIVKLDVNGLFWCQFAYQFAHEFCHILCNFDKNRSHANKWLEESFAEAASRYAIRRMSVSWKTRPPYPNWRSYAAALAKYADDLDAKKGEPLPEGMSLAQWYRRNEQALRKNACDREKNRVIARALLTLLEAEPASWEAVGYMNLSGTPRGASLREYLAAWHRRAPKKHRPFIEKVAGLFEISLP